LRAFCAAMFFEEANRWRLFCRNKLSASRRVISRVSEWVTFRFWALALFGDTPIANRRHRSTDSLRTGVVGQPSTLFPFLRSITSTFMNFIVDFRFLRNP